MLLHPYIILYFGFSSFSFFISLANFRFIILHVRFSDADFVDQIDARLIDDRRISENGRWRRRGLLRRRRMWRDGGARRRGAGAKVVRRVNQP